MKSFPSGSPQEEQVELQRVLGAVQAVNTCLPQTTPDSGTAAATSGLLNACSTLASGFSVFVLQMQVAVCWLWSQISSDQAAILALQTAVAALQAAQPTPIPGVISVAPGTGLGTGGTADLAAGSTTSNGVIHCVAGTGASSSGGNACVLTNTLGWPTTFRLVLSEGNTSNAPLLLDYNLFSGAINVNFYPLFGVFNDGDTFDISYSIEKIA